MQAYLDATGKVDVARVYEQVAMKGRGTVDLQNPIETQGLRNLDGFGGFDVKDGVMVGTLRRRRRAAGCARSATSRRTCRSKVQATYTLDGQHRRAR